MIAAHYDQLAAIYDRRWSRYVQSEVSWVVENWPDAVEAGLALDLGCGSGAMLEALRWRHSGLQLIGVDLSSKMLERTAARVPSVTVMEGDIEYQGFAATLPQADAVLSLSMLHHLRDIDGHLALLHDLVKPGGVAFLADFAVDGPAMRVAEMYFRVRQPVHRKALSHRDLRARLDHVFPAESTRGAILRPDRFWRVQIFRLSRP